MADSMCGPSNPLQSFRKHASADRTIQQDRLVYRQGSSSGFRSSPGPSAGLLDPEFEAFQAGFNPATLAESNADHHARRQFSGPTVTQAAAAPAWALDFQRLNISQPHSPYRALQSSVTQKPHASLDSWHHDFQRQQFPSSIQHTPQPLYEPRLNGFSSFGRPDQYTLSSPNLQNDFGEQRIDKGKEKQMEDLQDSVAFERAFEEHAAELLRLESAVRSRAGSVNLDRTVSRGQDFLMDDGSTLEDIRQRIAELQDASERLVAEELHRQEEQSTDSQDTHEVNKSSTNDDELAQTARELLEKVSDNKTEKFQQSSFLALMRKLRDGEMRVDGDKMVETEVSSAPAASA